MLEILLEDGLLRIVDCGDCISFTLLENGDVVNQINWDIGSVVDMIFSDERQGED